jgi:ribosome modulation factor
MTRDYWDKYGEGFKAAEDLKDEVCPYDGNARRAWLDGWTKYKKLNELEITGTGPSLRLSQDEDVIHLDKKQAKKLRAVIKEWLEDL